MGPIRGDLVRRQRAGRLRAARLPTAALLLGKATLAQLPAGAAWCAQLQPLCTNPSATTALSLSIVGAPVGSIPVGSIPVGSIPRLDPGRLDPGRQHRPRGEPARRDPDARCRPERRRRLRADRLHGQPTLADAAALSPSRDRTRPARLATSPARRRDHGQRHHPRDPPALGARLGVASDRRPPASTPAGSPSATA